MKIIYTLVLSIFLSSCIYQQSQQQEIDPVLRQACADTAKKQSRNIEWFTRCMNGDSSTIREGIVADLMAMDKETICNQIINSYGETSLVITKEIANVRKIDCKSQIAKATKEIAPRLTADEICSIWYNRSYFEEGLKELDKEVKRRNLDCGQIVNSARQTELAKQQMRIMQRHAQAAEIQAEAAKESAFYDYLNSQKRNYPRTTDCMTIGNMLNCNNY